MSFLRSVEYFAHRFHDKQETAWLAYKAGLDLVLPWGRRSGKTDFKAEIAIEDVEDYQMPVLYVARTQKQAREIIWPKLSQRLATEDKWKPNEAKLTYSYTASARGHIVIKGADTIGDDMVGQAYRLIICDEFALWKKPDIVKRVLVPMLADYNGQIIYGSTKRGKNHFYDKHMEALAHPERLFAIESTIFDNPYISPLGREKLIREYDGENDPLYRQEILNEYVSFEGKVFAFDVEAIAVNKWSEWEYQERCVHFCGLDLGYKPDPTAMVWGAHHWDHDVLMIYDEYEESEQLIRNHAESIMGQTRFEVLDTYSDHDPQIIAEFEDVGLKPITMAIKKDKDARLLRLVSAIRSGRVVISKNCKKLIQQMESYVWDQDGHDHLIDALSYLHSSITLPPRPKTQAQKDYEQEERFLEQVRARQRNEQSHQDFGEGY